MADNNLYKILSSLYDGEVKLKQRDRDIITGWLGYDIEKPSGDVKTVDARLDLLEAGTSAASGVLTIAGKTYTPASGSVNVASGDIIANVKTALAADATGLAGAADVYANDMFLSGKIDNIASSFLTGYQDSNDVLNVLTFGKNGQNITGTVLVDGTTIVKDANGKIASGVKLVKKETGVSANNAAEYFLADKNGTKLGDVEINVPKDQFLSAAIYNKANETLDLTFILADGSASTTPIDVHDMVHEYIGSDAITVADDKAGNSAISLKLDPAKEAFLSITANGLLLSGVQDAINAAVSGANQDVATISAALTDYLGENAVSGAFAAVDGRLDTLEAALTNYTGANAVSGKFAEIDRKLGQAGNATENDIFIADASGNLKDSGKKIGGEDFEATPSVNMVATEKAVYDLIHTDLAGLDTAVTSFVGGLDNM